MKTPKPKAKPTNYELMLAAALAGLVATGREVELEDVREETIAEAYAWADAMFQK